MTDSERIEYLEEVIKTLTEPEPAWIQAIKETGVKLTTCEAKILTYLKAIAPRAGSHEQIYQALYWDRHVDQMPDLRAHIMMVSNIKRKLAKSSCGLRVESQWGFGYKLTGKMES